MKLFPIFGALLASLCLVACTDGANNAESVDGSRPRFFAEQLVVEGWTDPKTGCEYLHFSTKTGGGDVAPRMTAEGQLGCRP